jgi:hypothetical protein
MIDKLPLSFSREISMMRDDARSVLSLVTSSLEVLPGTDFFLGV